MIHEPSAPPGGGYLGQGLAYVLNGGVGPTISYILLIALGIIALVIIVDIPLAYLIDRVSQSFSDWKLAAAERAAAKDVPGKTRKEKTQTPAAVADAVKSDETTARRKRTIEQLFGKKEEPKPEAQTAAPVVVTEATLKPVVAINGVRGNGGSETPDKSVGPTIPRPSDAESLPEEEGEFQLPPTSLLDPPQPPPQRVESELRENIEIIERTLEEFKVTANVVEIAVGPTVARYEIQLAPGIKVNKIVGLADNLAMQLAAIDVRVEAPIPGKAAIGVEVPNKHRALVGLREIVESEQFGTAKSRLAFALGKDVAGQPCVADLAKMPHMLIGGATNAGKSCGLNSLIASLLYRATPDELKFIMIDPKRVELTQFDGIPHLACPVVKNVNVAAGILRSVVQEMEHRYDLFSRTGSRNIEVYNDRVDDDSKMPYMVVVVDELCDLMMQAAAEVEGSITRLAQLARATGIHLVIATQRPSVDVITGVIKANISSRIAFAVSSHHDSRTILDQKGAERLIGRGDMLFLPIDAAKPVRIQGCYISEREVDSLCSYLKSQRKPFYTIEPSSVGTGSGGEGSDAGDVQADEYYEPSVRFVVQTGYCSTSMLQRKFKIGYTRAARIVDGMESQGIVGALDGAKPRQVLISKSDVAAVLGGQVGMRLEREDDEDDDVPPAEIIADDDENVFEDEDEEEQI